MKELKVGIFAIRWQRKDWILISYGDGRYQINGSSEFLKRGDFEVIREL